MIFFISDIFRTTTQMMTTLAEGKTNNKIQFLKKILFVDREARREVERGRARLVIVYLAFLEGRLGYYGGFWFFEIRKFQRKRRDYSPRDDLDDTDERDDRYILEIRNTGIHSANSLVTLTGKKVREMKRRRPLIRTQVHIVDENIHICLNNTKLSAKKSKMVHTKYITNQTFARLFWFLIRSCIHYSVAVTVQEIWTNSDRRNGDLSMKSNQWGDDGL